MGRRRADLAEQLLERARRILEHESAIARLRAEMSALVARAEARGEQEGPPTPRVRRGRSG